VLKKVKSYKWAIIIIIFIVVITAIRLTWMSFLTTLDYANSPAAEEGILDLRGWELNQKQTLQLNGEWEFYPSVFLEPNEQLDKEVPIYLDTPSNWKAAFTEDASFTYGTYRLQILLDDESTNEVAVKVNKLNNASAFYVNGERAGESGQAAVTEENHEGSGVPYSVSFQPNQNKIELMIHVSSNRRDGGITKPIRFGTENAIQFQNLLSLGLQLLLCVVLILHSVYALILYFMRSSLSKGLLYYTLLLVAAIFTVLGSDDKILFNWISVGYDWEIKLVYMAYVGVGAFIPLVIKQIFPNIVHKKALRYFIMYCFGYTFFILLASPANIFQTAKIFLFAVFFFSIFVSTFHFRKAKIDKGEGIFLILSCLSIGNNILWSSIKTNTSLDMMHYPFDLIITVLCFTAFWFKRFFRTTSESEKLAEKLQLENRRKDDFLVNTSHELRNPLHGMTNIVQSLLDDKKNPLNKEQQKSLSVLVHISNRMNFMLNDLLDVTRLKEKTVQLNIKKTKVQSVVAGVIDMTRLMAAGKPVQLRTEIPDTFPAVMADENRFIQILFNLIHNAIKFTDEGTITIHATKDKEMAYLHIEDTGIGIGKEDLEQIFAPYEQAEVNAKRASGGFGLGLHICKQLVELHHGTLEVQSEPGKGSTFIFSLPLYKGKAVDEEESSTIPLVKEAVNESLAAANEQPTLNVDETLKETKIRILIVDDDPINLRILSTILEREDYQIRSAISASQAIAKLEMESYDLVISDVMMPQVSGYELARIIREWYTISELPILLLTARTRTEDILTGFKSGANDYVTKPVDAWQLTARVRALTNLKTSVEERVRMEGAWLQLQIEPHFIFNTLNSIAALSNIDIEKMQKLLEVFSNYLRFSFDFHNADPVIPLKKELSLVHSYLYIEKTRFGDRLNIVWEVEANMDRCIPPLTIQPLVENAVKHGVMKNAQGGTVLIQVVEESEQMTISVQDNGKGMTEEEVKQLFTENTAKERTSVGLRNVNHRLKQFYGERLIVQSAPNEGTTVSFHIPVGKGI